MSSLRFKARMTKTAFEGKLVEEFGVENLTASPYVEEAYGGEKVKMTLYYLNNIGHCATWQGGKGWIFERVYEELGR